jgi:hypothetical protein
MRAKILKMVAENKLTPQEGYDILYGGLGKKGRFAKIRLRITGRPFLTFFLGLLLVFPVPLGLVHFGLRHADNADIAEYKDMILGLVPYTKGVKVKVNSKDAKIRLRVF